MNQKTFGFKLNVGKVSANPIHVTLEADTQERLGLAERWGVVSVEALTAELDLTSWKRDGVRVKGNISAQFTQACVVTLEPIASSISETIEALLVPEGSRLARVETSDIGEMIIDAEGPDAPETFQGDTIDIAQICEEFIVLSIDPYPRSDGAEMAIEDEPPTETDRAESPFAGLRDFKNKL